jgi:hypothetical protein
LDRYRLSSVAIAANLFIEFQHEVPYSHFEAIKERGQAQREGGLARSAFDWLKTCKPADSAKKMDDIQKHAFNLFDPPDFNLNKINEKEQPKILAYTIANHIYTLLETYPNIITSNTKAQEDLINHFSSEMRTHYSKPFIRLPKNINKIIDIFYKTPPNQQRFTINAESSRFEASTTPQRPPKHADPTSKTAGSEASTKPVILSKTSNFMRTTPKQTTPKQATPPWRP